MREEAGIVKKTITTDVAKEGLSVCNYDSYKLSCAYSYCQIKKDRKEPFTLQKLRYKFFGSFSSCYSGKSFFFAKQSVL